MKHLFCLQFSYGDKEVARDLINLIVDLQLEYAQDVHWMLSAACTTTVDQSMVDRLKEKFGEVHTHQCQIQVTGWPAGPNSQMREVVADVFVGHRDRGWNYDSFMLVEPDFVPLKREWIQLLIDEWREAKVDVLGAFMSSGMFWCYQPHINGNCMMSPKFVRETKFFRMAYEGSWDTALANIIVSRSRASKLIWNDYRLNTPHNPLPSGTTLEKYMFSAQHYPGNHPLCGQDIFPVYFHGIKGHEAINIVRQKLLS